MTGTITRVFLTRGFAFIRGEDGEDYFFQADESVAPWSGEVRAGMSVTFTPAGNGHGGNKLRALQVTVK